MIYEQVEKSNVSVSILKSSAMAKDHSQYFSLRCCCYTLFFLSSLSSILFLVWSNLSIHCYSEYQTPGNKNENRPLDLLTYSSAWNELHFPSQPPQKLLKIALFVKNWPDGSHAGGLERHALTLHVALAKRGHEVHIFTPEFNLTTKTTNLHFHLSKRTSGGYLDQSVVWKQFQRENATKQPFNVIHTESVGLMHTRSKHIPNLAVSWHGIAYESIHSDIIQELLRDIDTARSSILSERVLKVVEEIKFFPRYAHHVATSDHVGDVLKRIYMIPEERVHIILNGVDDDIFKPNDDNTDGDFALKTNNDQESKSLVIGIAGRLVKDKGHPLVYEAMRQMFDENPSFRKSVTVLVAGDGPWSTRYKVLGSNFRVLGPLNQTQLAQFYNDIDIFLNPTLRAQGLDHTLLEAMLVGKPLMATRLASITGSVIVGKDTGYTFSPSVEALKKALYEVWNDGRAVLKQKGRLARKRGLHMFSASKMAAAYERLFLCISENGKQVNDYCLYKS